VLGDRQEIAPSDRGASRRVAPRPAGKLDQGVERGVPKLLPMGRAVEPKGSGRTARARTGGRNKIPTVRLKHLPSSAG
jgi:hypothetical protein